MQIPLQLVCGCKGTQKTNPFPVIVRTEQILTAQKPLIPYLYIRLLDVDFL